MSVDIGNKLFKIKDMEQSNNRTMWLLNTIIATLVMSGLMPVYHGIIMTPMVFAVCILFKVELDKMMFKDKQKQLLSEIKKYRFLNTVIFSYLAIGGFMVVFTISRLIFNPALSEGELIAINVATLFLFEYLRATKINVLVRKGVSSPKEIERTEMAILRSNLGYGVMITLLVNLYFIIW